MIESISLIKKEHDELRSILTQIEKIIGSENEEETMKVAHLLTAFKDLWDKHEIREEDFFDELADLGKHNPENADERFVSEHRQLRGHWKILFDAVNSYDPAELKVSLDTDGRMLIEKFRNHMASEEIFFDKLLE